MDTTFRFTALIVREDDLYLAKCSEFDITSEGSTVESARANLTKAVSEFLETADPEEITRRLRANKPS
jgi:predicted RNase H-like HicB family nuclease